RFRQETVQTLAIGDTALEDVRLPSELLITQFFKLRLQAVDSLHRLPVGLEQTIIAATKYFCEEVCGHTCMPAPTALRAPDRLNWIQRTLASPEDKKRTRCSTDTAERLGFKSKPEILPVAKSGKSA